MKQLLTKERFAASVRVYIEHKRVIALHSAWYKKHEVSTSLSKCYNLMLMVKRNCQEYSYKQLAQQVLMHQNDLLTILPAPNNPSYQRQRIKIDAIIQLSKQITQA